MRLTAGDIKNLLADVNDDAEVYFYFNQQYGSRRFAINDISAFDSEEKDTTAAEDADEVYLFGSDAGYAPKSATNEFL